MMIKLEEVCTCSCKLISDQDHVQMIFKINLSVIFSSDSVTITCETFPLISTYNYYHCYFQVLDSKHYVKLGDEILDHT